VGAADRAAVTLPDGRVRTADVAWRDPGTGLTVLRLRGGEADLPWLPIAGDAPLETPAPTRPGAPLLDARGQVVGVTVSRDGALAVVPAAAVRALLEQARHGRSSS
jgi:hypothetical protein